MIRSEKPGRIKIPVLLQFVIMYLLIIGFVMTALLPIYYKTLELSKQSYLKDAEYNFVRSGNNMQRTLEEIYQIPAKMDDSPYYLNLKLTRSQKLPIESYSKLFMSQKLYAKQMTTLEDVDEVFLYLRNNTVIFGKERVFDSISEYLSFDLVYQEYEQNEIQHWMSTVNGRVTVLPATLASVHGGFPKKYLTVTMSRQTDSAVIGALFSESSLLRQFNIPNLPKDSFLYITDKEGALLYSYGYDKEPLTGNTKCIKYRDQTFSIIRTSIAMPLCNIVLGIPDYYFEELHIPLKKMISRYIWIAVAIGVLLSALFAIYNYIPIWKLLSIPLKKGFFKEKRTSGEFYYINRFLESCFSEITQLKTDVLNMESTLRANMFIRLLYGMVNTKDEYTLAMKLIPQMASAFRVALFEIKGKAGSPEENYISYTAYERLSNLFPKEFMLVQLNNIKAAMIFIDTEENLREFKRIFLLANQKLLEASEMSISVGISDRFFNGEKVHKAFFHAQSSLTAADSNGLNFYSYSSAKQALISIDFYGLQKLYGLLVSKNREAVEETIRGIARKLIFGGVGSRQEVMQAFCMVSFVLDLVIADAELESEDFNITEFREDEPIDILFESLNEDALNVINALEIKKNNANNELKESIIKYIMDNYSDPEIYADNIAEKYNISRNNVYSIVRDETGKSLNDYIEHLRMNKAIALLKTTDMSVADISDSCGYNSTNTFYKVFRKNYKVAPSSYRS